jgi:hypothetical protein
MADRRDQKTAVKVTFYDDTGLMGSAPMSAREPSRKTIGVLALKPNSQHTQNKRKLSRRASHHLRRREPGAGGWGKRSISSTPHTGILTGFMP